MKEIISAENIREIAASFQESRILLTAFELKIFSMLDKHLMSSEEVSGKYKFG